VPALIHDKNRSAGWLTTNEWIRDAHGVWTDIRETDVLDGYQQGREEGDEKHVCPLQLEVIRRCIRLYTNPGELVMDPFMGIGSTAVVALEQGRQAVGFELKESYHALAERNIARTAKGETPAGQLALTDGVAA
jgi:DNA modification methylase